MTDAAANQPIAPFDKTHSIGTRFEKQAEAQMFACLAHVGRRDALETYPRSRAENKAEPEHQYSLAVVLARQGEVEEALVLLRGVIDQNASHQAARNLAYRLIVHLAESMAKEAKWQRVSDLTVEALRVRPEGVDPTIDFAKFRGILPMSHLRSGDREEAARLWEQQLIENPHSAPILHNLALMHYWWARGVEKDGNQSSLVQRWQPAIIYWSLLQQVDGFWTEWSNNRARTWGFAISDEDLATLRKKLPEEQFDHRFEDLFDAARQGNHSQLAQQYNECLNAALLERRSALCWKQAIAFLPAGESVAAWLTKSLADGEKSRNRGTSETPGWIERFSLCSTNSTSANSNDCSDQLLGLPGGVGFFRYFGLLPQVAEISMRLSSLKGTEQCVASLRMLFSPDKLGQILVLVEDRNSPAEAIAQLDRVPKVVTALPEFVYLRSLARCRRGEQLSGHGDFAAAIDCWKQTYQLANVSCTDSIFAALLKDLAASAQSHVVSAIQKETKKLKATGKNDAAIALLEPNMAMDKDGVLLDHLCIHLCDRGHLKMNKKDYEGARKDFTRVLELKPGYERAKQGMGTTYNNQGCEERDSDKSIALFENALKWEPSNHTAKSNLASELRSKAVARVNASTGVAVRYAVDEAIRLLERAFTLVSSELKPGALALIQNLAETDASMVGTLTSRINHEELKKVVENLAIVYNMRVRIRRGY